MRRPPARLAIAVLASASLVAGCGSAASPAAGPAAAAPGGGAASLATSLVTSAGTWAVTVMGGSAASENNFWQLFVRPAGTTAWKLVTPAGVADNGGLVVADAGGQSLITGFRPSQDLTYTPLTVTRDAGSAWSPTGPLGGALADVPDALAVGPATAQLLALLTDGTVRLAVPSYTTWHTLVTRRALAGSAAGRRCGLTALSAVSYTSSGAPLLGGTCSRSGMAGIFTEVNGSWQATGPAVPSATAHDPLTVLRLTRTGNSTVALLKVGQGTTASLVAARSADGVSRWTVSTPLRLHGKLSIASFGPAGTTVLNGSTAATISAGGGTWRPLPAVPAGTATLAPGPAGGFDALAVHRTKLTVWQLSPGATTWHVTQVINVPIQFGSSS
jgi:hypothetical protein